jgi:hypothetical protein
MEALRRAAEYALAQLGEDEAAQAELGVERLTLEVRAPQGSELVTLRLSETRLAASCTCAERGCVHIRTALQLVIGQRAAGFESTRRSSTHMPRVVVPDARPPELKSGVLDRAALAEALEDVVTAVVRAGVASERVASITETLARVEHAAGTPLPLGVRRWLGRMREALEAQDVSLAAQALAAASVLAADLRSDTPLPAARERLFSWLGDRAGAPLERISDRMLLEVGREWVTGTERTQIERRYLIDLNSGEAFREESVRREKTASVGSCPRLIGVALAEAELGCAPRRMRLLQYTTTPKIDRASWDLLAAWGQRDTEALTAAYRTAQQKFGALSEPFALAAPRGVDHRAQPALVLDRGAALPLFAEDEPGLLRRFEALIEDASLAWVAGRLCDRDGRLMLKPLAAGLLAGDGVRHERL